jgi:ribosomal protein S12 methylthiotransferase accessory factor
MRAPVLSPHPLEERDLMAMEVTFPGGIAVNALYKGFTIPTDQPEKSGGKNSAPAPFDLFVASIGTCAGFFAMRFCQERDIDTSDLKVTLDTERDEERKRLAKIKIEIQLPQGFPEKYKKAIIRAADQCPVKRHIIEPPEFEVVAV